MVSHKYKTKHSVFESCMMYTQPLKKMATKKRKSNYPLDLVGGQRPQQKSKVDSKVQPKPSEHAATCYKKAGVDRNRLSYCLLHFVNDLGTKNLTLADNTLQIQQLMEIRVGFDLQDNTSSQTSIFTQDPLPSVEKTEKNQVWYSFNDAFRGIARLFETGQRIRSNIKAINVRILYYSKYLDKLYQSEEVSRPPLKLSTNENGVSSAGKAYGERKYFYINGKGSLYAPFLEQLQSVIVSGSAITYTYKFPYIKVDFVEGPISLSKHYSKEMEKTIYIFGEVHQKKKLCRAKTNERVMDIANFLELTLLENKNKVVDIFLEVNLRWIQEKTRQYGYLEDISDKFRSCLLQQKDCQYKNARIHYTDVRFNAEFNDIQRYKKNLNELLKELEDITPTQNDDSPKGVRLKYLIEKLRQTVDPILRLEENEDKKAFQVKIKKQIHNIRDSRVQDEISILIPWQKAIHSIVTIVKNTQTILDNVVEYTNGVSDLYEILSEASLGIIYAHSKLMDIYLMARVFRTFRNGSDPKSIIIYVGNNHAETYRQILTAFGFQEINKAQSRANSRDVQCVDLQTFKQPFFS